MCQAIMRCGMSIHGEGFGLLVEGEGERDWGGWRRGEASRRLRATGGRKGQGEMEMEEPYRDFDPFLSSQRSLNCASPLSFTLPLKIGVVSASQPPECLWAWKGSRPCQKEAITGTGGARQSARGYVKGGLCACCAVGWGFCL